MSKSLSGLKKLKYDKEHEHELAFAEVISYNKANLERMEQNENRQQNRQQTVIRTVGRTKGRKNCYHENLRNI